MAETLSKNLCVQWCTCRKFVWKWKHDLSGILQYSFFSSPTKLCITQFLWHFSSFSTYAVYTWYTTSISGFMNANFVSTKRSDDTGRTSIALSTSTGMLRHLIKLMHQQTENMSEILIENCDSSGCSFEHVQVMLTASKLEGPIWALRYSHGSRGGQMKSIINFLPSFAYGCYLGWWSRILYLFFDFGRLQWVTVGTGD